MLKHRFPVGREHLLVLPKAGTVYDCYMGLCRGYMGLYMGYMGLYKGYMGLYKGYMGLYKGYMGIIGYLLG